MCTRGGQASQSQQLAEQEVEHLQHLLVEQEAGLRASVAALRRDISIPDEELDMRLARVRDEHRQQQEVVSEQLERARQRLAAAKQLQDELEQQRRQEEELQDGCVDPILAVECEVEHLQRLCTEQEVAFRAALAALRRDTSVPDDELDTRLALLREEHRQRHENRTRDLEQARQRLAAVRWQQQQQQQQRMGSVGTPDNATPAATVTEPCDRLSSLEVLVQQQTAMLQRLEADLLKQAETIAQQTEQLAGNRRATEEQADTIAKLLLRMEALEEKLAANSADPLAPVELAAVKQCEPTKTNSSDTEQSELTKHTLMERYALLGEDILQEVLRQMESNLPAAEATLKEMMETPCAKNVETETGPLPCTEKCLLAELAATNSTLRRRSLLLLTLGMMRRMGACGSGKEKERNASGDGLVREAAGIDRDAQMVARWWLEGDETALVELMVRVNTLANEGQTQAAAVLAFVVARAKVKFTGEEKEKLAFLATPEPEVALQLLRKHTQGYALGQHLLAKCLLFGVGTGKDPREAVNLLQIWSLKGYSSALSTLGYCYSVGAGVAKDEAGAAKLFQQAVEAGNARTAYLLGLCFKNGTGVVKDEERAVQLYQQASDAGFAEATHQLGVCYFRGTGVVKDQAQAVCHFQEASNAGNAKAMYMLGLCFESGTGVERDKERAVLHYQNASDAGLAEASVKLGLCYKNGTGVEKDKERAARLYQQASEAGNRQATYHLGLCYAMGAGVDKDEAQAARLYQQSHDAGSNEATFLLGTCYLAGKGVASDQARAVQLYKQASDAGLTSATHFLGECYLEGTGVAKDEARAVQHFQQASDAGFSEATHQLGLCYEEGIGVAQDLERAVQLYQQASNAGVAAATVNLALCYELGLGVPANLATAVRLYQQAADGGDTGAIYRLGEMHRTGQGVPQDLARAKHLLQLAADAGHNEALNSLQQF